MDVVTGPASGTVLDGRYRLGAMIARGGMSTVYRGLDTRLDRPVAVKVMSPQYVADPTFLSRFEREARLAASLPGSMPIQMYKNNVDGKGASYGTHENYLCSRDTPFPAIIAGLTPFFTTRQVFAGAGRVGIGPAGQTEGFQLGQRSFNWCFVVS